MWFDIIIALILLVGLVLGYRRGFMAQIGAFIGVFFGIICCQVFADDLALRFGDPDDSAGTIMLNSVMAYFIIFVVCYLMGRALGFILSKTTTFLKLGSLNSVAGAVFKVAEYMLGLSILLNLWIGLFPDTELRSRHDGMTEAVVNFAPTVFGSETANEIFSTVSSATAEAKQSLENAKE